MLTYQGAIDNFGACSLPYPRTNNPFGLVWFVLFNDIWSQQGHSVLCTIYDHTFSNLQITRSDIRPHREFDVGLVIGYDHFNLLRGFVWVCMG